MFLSLRTSVGWRLDIQYLSADHLLFGECFGIRCSHTYGGAPRNILLLEAGVLLVWAQDWAALRTCSSPFVRLILSTVGWCGSWRDDSVGQPKWEQVNCTWEWNNFLFQLDMQSYCISVTEGLHFLDWLHIHRHLYQWSLKISECLTFMLTEYFTSLSSFSVCR